MSNLSTQRIRIVLQKDRGLGRISLDLASFLDLSSFLTDDLDRIESQFATWQTKRSLRRAARHELRRSRRPRSTV